MKEMQAELDDTHCTDVLRKRQDVSVPHVRFSLEVNQVLPRDQPF